MEDSDDTPLRSDTSKNLPQSLTSCPNVTICRPKWEKQLPKHLTIASTPEFWSANRRNWTSSSTRIFTQAESEPPNCQWCCPASFIKKKNGKLCLIQDYHALTVITIKNRYPLPFISELVAHLHGTCYFTKLDVHWSYQNVCLKEGDKWKAAFCTNRGLFELVIMMFGLTNAPVMMLAVVWTCNKPPLTKVSPGNAYEIKATTDMTEGEGVSSTDWKVPGRY